MIADIARLKKRESIQLQVPKDRHDLLTDGKKERGRERARREREKKGSEDREREKEKSRTICN